MCIRDRILSDLKIAETGCPAMYTKEPYARNGMNIAVSEGAVKATMAYVYMCMAEMCIRDSPYGEMIVNNSDSYSYNLNANLTLLFKIMKGLTLSVQGGYDSVSYTHLCPRSVPVSSFSLFR